MGAECSEEAEGSEEGVRRTRFRLHCCLGHAGPSTNFHMPEPALSPFPSFTSSLLSTCPPRSIHLHPLTHLPIHLSHLPYLPHNQFTLCSSSTQPSIYLVHQSSPSPIHPPSVHPSPFTHLPHSFIHPLTQMSIHSPCIHPNNIPSAQVRNKQARFRRQERLPGQRPSTLRRKEWVEAIQVKCGTEGVSQPDGRRETKAP